MELNEKQIQILEVAEKLFAEHGFDGTSVRQIAKEANINVAMISYYFGSKAKLLEALLIYRMSDFRVGLDSIISQKNDYKEALDDILALVIMRIHNNRRMYKIVNFEYSNGNCQLDFENYTQQKKENFDVIKAFVLEGQKAGVFKKEVNLKLIIPTILGTYLHIYYNKNFFQDLLGLNDEEDLEHYVKNDLTKHIQQTIKALLTYEN